MTGRDVVLDIIRQARRTRDEARKETERDFREIIQRAFDAGYPVSKIAGAAGLTRARIYQIVGDR